MYVQEESLDNLEIYLLKLPEKYQKHHIKIKNGTEMWINRIQVLYDVRYLKCNTYVLNCSFYNYELRIYEQICKKISL